ncbi:MAG: xanthine dehydrogenase family protein molybdopterin-binding subunit [Chloroflexota bacterium]
MTESPVSPLGQRLPMVDAVARVTGAMDYALDIELPGMLQTRILRSPHAHARLVRIDASRAAALRGVTVLTRDDILGREDVNPTFGLFIRDQPPVALDKVRHVGDPVAAVAAPDDAAAEEALDLIEVEYEPLPAVFDVEAALEPGAPILHEGPRSLASRRPDILARQPGFEGTNVIHQFIQRKGDVDAGFAGADEVIEHTFYSPPVQHVPMEPHVVVARWSDNRLTLWDSTQAPNWVQIELANLFKLSASDVRVIVGTLGGGYGGKIDPSIEPIAAWLARKARRPVRLALRRDEEFYTHTKHAARVRIRTGAKRDGTLVAHQATCWYNGGAYAKETPEKITRGYASMGPYRVPNVHVDSFGVYTNITPSAAFRGFGIPQVSWAHESQMDILADALGLDPLELRLRNVLKVGDQFSTGETITEDLHYRELLKIAAEKIGWSEGVGPFREGSKIRARGIATIIKGMSAFPSSAVAKLNTDGSLNVLTGSVEMGQGALTALTQIAADEATLPMSRVRVSTPDTAVTPWDQMSAASRTTNNMGKAIRGAVVDVKKQLLEMAAQRLEISVDDLDVVAGTVQPRGSPDKALPFAALLGPARVGNLLGRGSYQAVSHLDLDGQGIGSPQWHPCVCAAEVEVDEETGRTTILKMHMAVYVGRMINPLQCELQVEGAATFGIGQALFEEILWDESGNLTNPNLSDYMVPSMLDLPAEFGETILETDTNEVHGIGETGLPAVMPAVGNAVSRAIGKRIPTLPLTPEKVLRAIWS